MQWQNYKNLAFIFPRTLTGQHEMAVWMSSSGRYTQRVGHASRVGPTHGPATRLTELISSLALHWQLGKLAGEGGKMGKEIRGATTQGNARLCLCGVHDIQSNPIQSKNTRWRWKVSCRIAQFTPLHEITHRVGFYNIIMAVAGMRTSRSCWSWARAAARRAAGSWSTSLAAPLCDPAAEEKLWQKIKKCGGNIFIKNVLDLWPFEGEHLFGSGNPGLVLVSQLIERQWKKNLTLHGQACFLIKKSGKTLEWGSQGGQITGRIGRRCGSQVPGSFDESARSTAGKGSDWRTPGPGLRGKRGTRGCPGDAGSPRGSGEALSGTFLVGYLQKIWVEHLSAKLTTHSAQSKIL